MKIVNRIPSRERCTEAGWFAYDFILDEPVTKELILSLRPFGSFVFLSMLSKPFFKVENHHYIMKGVLGDDFFRMAVHKDYEDHFDKVTEHVNQLEL